MSEIGTVTDVEYREAGAGGCCPKGTSELEFLCIIYISFLYPKPVLHGKSTEEGW